MHKLFPLLFVSGFFLVATGNQGPPEKSEKLTGWFQKDKKGKLIGVVLFDNSLFSWGKPDFSEEDLKNLDWEMCSNLMIASKMVSDTTLIHLGKYSKLTSLSLFYTKISDDGLTHFLNKQKFIFYLDLYHTKTTDISLQAIGSLPELSFLTLTKTNITDKGLENLITLKNLEVLTISETNISDAGLVHLNRIRSLRWLDLSQTEITDAGVMKLKDLNKLNTLIIHSTKVTNKGVEYLRKHFPGLIIDKEKTKTKYDFLFQP